MNTPSSPLNIHCIGVGNAGLAMLEAVAARQLPGVTCVAVNTDDDALKLSAATRKTISDAVATMPIGSDANRTSRIHAALMLVMACPEFLVQK